MDGDEFNSRGPAGFASFAGPSMERGRYAKCQADPCSRRSKEGPSTWQAPGKAVGQDKRETVSFSCLACLPLGGHF
jgi:hypothetical protein